MSSGKTTFLNALIEQIPADKHERVGILEDVFELSAPHLLTKITCIQARKSACKGWFAVLSDLR
jgi:Flp pilus assembly CpaF family ATPase